MAKCSVREVRREDESSARETWRARAAAGRRRVFGGQLFLHPSEPSIAMLQLGRLQSKMQAKLLLAAAALGVLPALSSASLPRPAQQFTQLVDHFASPTAPAETYSQR